MELQLSEVNNQLETEIADLEEKAVVDKISVKGATLQETTPSPDNVIPIKNVNVYGVNELDKDNVSILNGQITISSGTLANSSENNSLILKVKPNTTYTISKTLSSRFRIADFESEPVLGSAFNEILYDDSATALTYTTSSIGNYLVVNYWNTSSTNSEEEVRSSIKIEEGSTATPYTQHEHGLLDLNLQKEEDTQTVTFTCKRLHEGDKINDEGFVYKREIAILDGTEEWTDFRTWGNYYRVCLALTKATTYLTSRHNSQICSHYEYNNTGTIGNNDKTRNGIFAQYQNTNNFYFVTDKTSLEDFKTFLAEQYANGTPVTVEYELATIEREYFNTASQTLWNTLKDLLMQGYTFVDSSSDELQPTITLIETANEVYSDSIQRFKELETANIYSTEEQVVGKWIDGKPIYRKIVNIPSLPNTTSTYYPHGISYIALVVNFYGCTYSSTGYYFSTNHYWTDGGMRTSVNANNIIVNASKDYSEVGANITIEYTKTTD